MDFSFCVLLASLRKKSHENAHILVFRSNWECLMLKITDTGKFHLCSTSDFTELNFCLSHRWCFFSGEDVKDLA